MVSYFTHGVTLAYRTFGHGAQPVLAFHGFGRTGADFSILEPQLGARCTIYAFDLHFHGKSPGYPERADQPFTPHELAVFFTAFLDMKGFEKATLLGYSLGGRISLCLLDQMADRLDMVLLAAPDGLKTLPWYRGMAATPVGRRIYKRFVEKPAMIHGVINGLRKLRLMNERMHRFLIGQTDSQAKRILVRDVWLSYRLIEPDLAHVVGQAWMHDVPIHMFFGERDSVIKPELGENLRKHAPELITSHELPFGHVLLTPELGAAIKGLLDSSPRLVVEP